MSSTDLSYFAILAALFTAALCATWLRTATRSTLPLPPGPNKLPLVGNLFDMSALPWETCMLWSKTFQSDIIHLDLAGTSVIVLSSVEATDALLRKSIYSDRPVFHMAGELMGWDFLMSLMHYGEEWRTHRRLFVQETSNLMASHKFHQAERLAAHALLRRLLRDPEGFRDHLRLMPGEVMISAAYGIDSLPANDPYISLAEEATGAFSLAMVPGRFLVDSIPLLRYVPAWFPGARFKRIAREVRSLTQRLRDVPFAEAKRRMESGCAQSSFTANALRNGDLAGTQYYDERTVKNVAAMMYMGGTETTFSVLSTFILAMLANPDAQRTAQIEIDSVVRHGDLPDFSDKQEMPYVAALVKELLRWRNATPFAAPHFLTTEDEYRGYRLPARSLIIGNAWAILHDEIMYPAPYSFKPERFLLDGKLNPEVRDPEAAFGFGRRICPGQHMGTSSVWIAVVSMLAMFNITKAVGEDGTLIEPSYEDAGGIVLSPVPFKCKITPRSEATIRAIQATCPDL
ncbi:cytochrome P450 [Mycena haematopus]|nr:cytochrome P450 [Mycena haematopus]